MSSRTQGIPDIPGSDDYDFVICGENQVPVEYTIDLENCIVKTHCRGIVTARDISELSSKLAKDSRFAPRFSEVVTFADNCNLQMGFLDFRAVSTLDPFSNSSRRALVIGSRGALYGLARMFQTARSENPNIRIMEKFEDALNWLSQKEQTQADSHHA